MNYKKEFEKAFQFEIETSGCPPISRLSFTGSHIFDFTTYDDEMDEMLASKMIEVIDCILNNKTFEYQEDEGNYINYITMVNMPFLKDKINWGTSIRGAWLDEYGHHSEPQPPTYKISCIGLELPKKEIKRFMKDLVEWSKS